MPVSDGLTFSSVTFAYRRSVLLSTSLTFSHPSHVAGNGLILIARHRACQACKSSSAPNQSWNSCLSASWYRSYASPLSGLPRLQRWWRCRRWRDSAGDKERSYSKDGYDRKNRSRGVSLEGIELLTVDGQVCSSLTSFATTSSQSGQCQNLGGGRVTRLRRP